jgi:hypothetical protein
MNHSNTGEVIVIDDSDSDDYPQPGASSVLPVDRITGVSNTANLNATGPGRPPASRRGKSEPSYTGLNRPTPTQHRRRITKSVPHDVIDVDSDEPTDEPPVSFRITLFVLKPTTTIRVAKTGQG